MSKMGAIWLELDSMDINPEEATDEEIQEAIERVKKAEIDGEIERLKGELPAKPMEHLKDED